MVCGYFINITQCKLCYVLENLKNELFYIVLCMILKKYIGGVVPGIKKDLKSRTGRLLLANFPKPMKRGIIIFNF